MKLTNGADIDLIMCWPRSMDYPLWRDFADSHADLFRQIIIVFTETNVGIDYSDFVRSSMNADNVVFLDSLPVGKGQDWRNVATNQALDVSTAEWVWFTEQDLLIRSPFFWKRVAAAMSHNDVIGYYEGDRMHPSNLFVKRKFIDQTGRDFGVVPNVSDHFYKFISDLMASEARIFVMEYKGDIFYHMNGLSHNLGLIQRGEEVAYKPDEFRRYLRLTLDSPLLNPDYKYMVERYLGVAP